MKPLRLPIRQREDLTIYHFPTDVDADERAAELAARIMKQNPRGLPVRVVSLEDRGAYREALDIAMEQARGTALASWVADPERAVFGMRVKHGDGRVTEHAHQLRIVQVLLN